MQSEPCQLCGKPVGADDDAYCQQCRQMDLNLRFLIEALPAEARDCISMASINWPISLQMGLTDAGRTTNRPKALMPPSGGSAIDV